MYTLENIIDKVTRTDNDKINVLLINEGYHDYIERLCNVPHNFILVGEYHQVQPWDQRLPPSNLTIVNRLHELGQRNIDVIVALNRISSYEFAKRISDVGHIPMIVVDQTTSHNKAPIPFFANANVDNVNVLVERTENITVSLSKIISDTWLAANVVLNVQIPTPPRSFKKNPKANKILIDKALPKQYLDSLPIIFHDNKFTVDKNEALVYLHLWQYVTPLMLDCMASGIPVVTFQSIDFQDIIKQEACILINELNIVQNERFLSDLLKFPKLEKIKHNAIEYSESTNMGSFRIKWDRLLKHATRQCYVRE